MSYILSTKTNHVMKVFLPMSLALILLSCGGESTEKKQINRSNSIPVTIAAIDAATGINTIHASGFITTENEVRLSFKIGGVIDQVSVQEGQQVRKGQLLASLNSTEINAQVKQVQLAVDKAQRDYQRAYNLYKDSVATLEQVQNSKTGLDIARENLEQALFNRKYANIYAPADGFIIKKLLNTGEVTGPGSPVLIMRQLGSGSKWVLRAGVADKEYAQIESGNKATITTDAFPGKLFNAVVKKKALAADPASGSFEIELLMDVKGLQPAVGMFGNAIITPSKVNKGFGIPYEALLEANGNKGIVFVTNDRKTVQRVEVTIASIEQNRVLITDGLSGHAYVVISGSPYLTDGASITITSTNNKP
jgi:RND family efflux transporter MFP subunit